MITTIKTINTSITSHSYLFVCLVKTLEVYSPSEFQGYNTSLLIIVTMLYIRVPEITLIVVLG